MTAGTENRALAGGLAVVAVGCLALSDVAAKILLGRLDFLSVVVWRGAVAVPLLALLWLRVHRPGTPLLRLPGLQLLRGVLAFVAIALFYIALARAPFASVVAVTVTAPILMGLFGVLVLGERLAGWLWAVIAAGSAGAVLVIWPADWSGAGSGAYLAAFGSAVAYAAAGAVSRLMARRDPAEASSTVTYLVATLLAAAALLTEGPALPAASDLPLVVLLGAAGAAGMLVYTYAYNFSGLSGLACWDNVIFVWALLFGWLVFAELPEATAILGGLVVMVAAFVVTHYR